MRVRGEPAADAIARDARPPREHRKERDDERGEHAGGGDDGKPARTTIECELTAATDAIGVKAALSSIPSTIRLSPTVPKPARVPGKRLTHAMRTASSIRPGSAMPPTHAAPPANASACEWAARASRKAAASPTP